MIWHAMPPEFNTARLMAGAGAEPMLQAATGWETFAIELETQADELAASLVSLQSVWTGAAADRLVSATMPMVTWLRAVSAQAHKRSAQALAQATAYTQAMATTPPLPEIAQNHVTRAVLHATNFFGVNTVPIGVNEFDYFVRMWNQAAGAMDVYQAETALNMLFEPIMPATPIVIPGVGEAAIGAALGRAAAGVPGAMVRNAVIEMVGAQAAAESVKLHAGRAASQANQMAVHAEGQAERTRNTQTMAPQQSAQQGAQMGMQMGMQLGSTLAQIPQQAVQMVSQPMQQLAQPLQQVSSLFGQLGSSLGDKVQVGLLGTNPLSNHPLVGGTGPAAGAGLVRAASLPGAAGTMARTPLMAGLIGQTTTSAAATGAAAGASGAGVAPVGGPGGMGPAGLGQRGTSGGSKQGLKAPQVLPQDLGEDEEDDW
ncbi:PPE family protein [Mycolicibacterium phlei]